MRGKLYVKCISWIYMIIFVLVFIMIEILMLVLSLHKMSRFTVDSWCFTLAPGYGDVAAATQNVISFILTTELCPQSCYKAWMCKLHSKALLFFHLTFNHLDQLIDITRIQVVLSPLGGLLMAKLKCVLIQWAKVKTKPFCVFCGQTSTQKYFQFIEFKIAAMSLFFLVPHKIP